MAQEAGKDHDTVNVSGVQPRERLELENHKQIILEALAAFEEAWFPNKADINAVQSFWFGAKYPRERKFFRRLCRQLEHSMLLVHNMPPENRQRMIESLDLPTLLRFCIFLDQQSRNARAIEQDGSEQARHEADARVAACTGWVAETAKGIIAMGKEASNHDQGLLAQWLIQSAQASVAQLCFFTLCLRHTNELEDAYAGQQILDELLEVHPGMEVSTAFCSRNKLQIRRLEAEAYAQKQIHEGHPELWVDDGAKDCSRPDENDFDSMQCLAPHLHEQTAIASCLEWAQDCQQWQKLAQHPLCIELTQRLVEHGLNAASAHVVLSYSGGVDSSAHLLLLLAATGSWNLPGNSSIGPRVSCLFLSYPNRDEKEVEGERKWVRWVCSRLRVRLYAFTIRLARPHGEDAGEADCGLTREAYERYTKEIRFRMYRCVLESSGSASPSAIVLGHHLDDVDENRLNHLQSGHMLGDVEGMRVWREVDGVHLLRPLLHHRKVDFLELLQMFPTPFFRDSTPSWSVRGTTRAALDSFEPALRSEMCELLNDFGSLATEAGAVLDSEIEAWARDGVHDLELPRGTRGLLLNLDSLLHLGASVSLARLAEIVQKIRCIWNPRVVASGKTALIAEIPEPQDVEWNLFERGFLTAADGLLSRRVGHYHTSETVSVNRRAIHHLYKTAQDCRKEHFGGGLTQEIGYVHVAGPPQRALVLYSAVAYPSVDFKSMRSAIVQRVQKALAPTAEPLLS